MNPESEVRWNLEMILALPIKRGEMGLVFWL